MRAAVEERGEGERKKGAHTNEPLNSKIIKIKSHKEVVEGAPPRVSKTVTRQRQRQEQGQGPVRAVHSLQSSHSPRSPGLAIASGMAIVAAGAAAAEDADAVDAL